MRKAEAGLRNTIGNAWFCARFGGPCTGIGMFLKVFLDDWRTTVFDPIVQAHTPSRWVASSSSS